ncbi:stage V sporulation protein AE [Tyzzerella sp. An114]|uniref:stage V sporulation protein AE n=1 Tax=Tyzzerella sp. An114 TaxID=1965545 RepID=UPI000B444692|nr:stage V sporulation protein AE [Tyzzerella sp. An114]OUQ59557.1 stage V sporulation protein AE [Tyzzerella sp. An114]
MEYLKAFIVGGIICVIGQILIDRTKLMSGRILVMFVILGCILGGLGIYEYIADFGGAGATVPLTGFGYNLSKGVIKEIDQNGFLGIFTGGLKASAGGISAALLFAFLASLVFEPKEK